MADRLSRSEQLAGTHAAVEAEREAEARAFRPAEDMEALALRVIGGWENLLGEVNFTRFHAAGYSAGRLDQERLPRAMRDVADAARVRWPHGQWATTAVIAKSARDKLAHMLYISSISGEMPHRTMNIVRLGRPGGPRRSADGNPAELSWRDETWSMQTRHAEAIQEQALIQALEG